MAENFERALPLVLQHEGGYVDHPRDPGGATNLGVTIGTLSDWLGRPASKAEVKALTRDSVAPIYRKNYWDATGCGSMASGVDYCHFDAAVNSGPGQAKRWYAAARNKENAAEIVKAYCARRRGFLQGLRTFSTFGKGWMRRVAGVEAIATKWAMVAGVDKPITNNLLRKEAAQAGTASASQKRAVAGGVSLSPAPMSAGAFSGPDWTLWLGLGITVLLMAAAALIWRASALNAARQKAFLAMSDGKNPEGFTDA